MSRDLYVVTQRCADTFKKAGVPLTDDQVMVLAGVLGVEIEKAGREGMAMGEAMATRKSAQQDAPTDAKKERFDRLQDILSEYRKGCGNTIGEGPENCPECVRAFVDAVQRYANRQSGDAPTAGKLREPKNGDGWRVVWWNESVRMMLPDDKRLDSFQGYKNGTLVLTIKEADAARAQRAAAQGDA